MDPDVRLYSRTSDSPGLTFALLFPADRPCFPVKQPLTDNAAATHAPSRHGRAASRFSPPPYPEHTAHAACTGLPSFPAAPSTPPPAPPSSRLSDGIK
ncbi:hypothetical protein CEH78_002171 [Salmonella enterica]|nr:hypothetical protein [Salmonella enterica]